MGYPMRLGIIRVHLRAMQSFKDARGIDRKAGEEWMITRNDSEAFIPDVHETVIAHIRSTVLTHRQYAYVTFTPHNFNA
jgi:major vault protein